MKKIVCLLLVVFLLTAMVGCGSSVCFSCNKPISGEKHSAKTPDGKRIVLCPECHMNALNNAGDAGSGS